MRLALRFVVAQVVIVGVTLSIPWAVLGIYPGALRPTGAVLCPDDKPTARVVEYSEPTPDGATASNATLFCLGERGDLTEVGTWRPLGLFFAGWLLAMEVLVLPFVLLSRRRQSRRPSALTVASVSAWPGSLSGR